MAVGFPAKTTYANGDVFSASDINDTNGTLNLLGSSVAYAAGKNKIINGDFYINQRNFTSNTTTGSYNFDRWLQLNSGGTFTLTPQTFTAGAAPVAGYEGKNYLQAVVASQSGTGDYAVVMQRIENARTFAGQTFAFSFWAKATSGTPKVALEVSQSFGIGGSSPTYTAMGAVTISTSWARYTITGTVPSLTGQTVGTANDCLEIFLWCSGGSTFASRSSSIGLQNNTFQFWGVQMENGSTATAFQTATGTIQGELAACQRYYVRFASSDAYANYAVGTASQTNTTDFVVSLPVTMRINPSALDYSNIGVSDGANAILGSGTLAIPGSTNGNDKTFVRYTKTGATQFRPYLLINNAGAGYIGFSAEL